MDRGNYWNKWIGHKSPIIGDDLLTCCTKMLHRFSSQSVDSSESTSTFYQLLGYGHYENMTTNVLAYLFEDNRDHGLRDLFVMSWLDAVGRSESMHPRVEEVLREYSTDDNKRIDLVIVLQDKVIGIENKIYASLYNDLSGYKEQLVRDFPGKEIQFSVLSMNEVPNSNRIGEISYITYSKFISHVEQGLGKYVIYANQNKLPQILDFIKTLKLMANNGNIDNEFAEFCSKNKEQLSSFLIKYDEQSRAVTEKMKLIKVLLADVMPDLQTWKNFVLYKNITLSDDGVISVDSIFNLTGIEINLWERTPSNKSKIIMNKIKDKPGLITSNGRLIAVSADKLAITAQNSHVADRMRSTIQLVESYVR